MLHRLITLRTLQDAAGRTTFQRGEDYFSSGAVRRLRIEENAIRAKVEGTQVYEVELRARDEQLTAECTCPHSSEGNFCKHCVAVGLSWLDQQGPSSSSDKDTGRERTRRMQRDPWKEIRRYLESQSPASLTDMLLDFAQRHDELYESLLLKSERAQGGDRTESAFRRAIDKAVQVRDFIDWRKAGIYARRIDTLVDSLEELLLPDTASLLVGLAEYAIEQTENALEDVDDSNGEVGDIVRRLGELHCAACTLAQPDPVLLAERLFRLETTLPFGLCSFDVIAYRAPLGKKGLQRYRELVEAEWHKLKPRTRRDDYDAHRACITRLMERLAEASGDVDTIVSVKSKDLSTSHAYYAITRVLTDAGRHDEALAWAERGLKAFPDRLHDDLQRFLVAAYLERSRNDEALALTWKAFATLPAIHTYEDLQKVSSTLGVWPQQRTRALAWIDRAEEEGQRSGDSRFRRSSPSDQSLRVSIALWEKDIDAAWEAACKGNCRRDLLIELADKLETNRPDHAISLYQQIVPKLVEQTNNHAYAEAARLLRKTGRLMTTQNRSQPFREYLSRLRAGYKAKRNFVKLLDAMDRDLAQGR